MKILMSMMLFLLLGVIGASAQVPVAPFDPPTPAGWTHYVDISAPTATDINNPYGSLTKPRRSVPGVLPAGSVVEVRGGPYNIGGAQGTITSQGNAQQPAFVRCVGSPLVQGAYGARLALAGSYGVWEGCRFDWTAVTVIGDHWVFRGNEVRGHSPAGNSAAVSTSGSYVVFRENWIHHNGDSESAKEIDIHGILVIPGASLVWVLDNHIEHNGGDAIQVGQAQSAEPWAQGVFIGGNTMHEDRENAIDVKKSRDVIIAGNVVYGYKERTSSSGEGIVTHDGAQRVWVLNNFVAASVRGIVSTGADLYVVAGNVLYGILHNPANSYDPASLYGSHGIFTQNTTNSYHFWNTIWASDGGISMPPGNAAPTAVFNNLVQATYNQIVGTISQNQANWSVQINGDPQVVDLKPQPGSPLIGAGVTTTVPAAFEFLYGVPFDTDIAGAPRASLPSIGALEP